MPPGGSQEDPPSNPFVRFKHHVDSNIASGFNTMFGSSKPPPSDAQTQTEGIPSPSQFLNLLGLRSVLSSPYYSPSSLADLPQPIPNDVPAHLDKTIFTFEDAFEDLLSVTQGHSLPDIEHKYNQRKLLRQMFPDREPGWFFLKRLEASGLLHVSSPPSLVPEQLPRPDAPWESLHRQLEERADEVWGRERSQQPTPGEGILSRIFDLEKIIDDGLQTVIRLGGEDNLRKVMNEIKKAVGRETRDGQNEESESTPDELIIDDRERERQLQREVRTLTNLAGEDRIQKALDAFESSFERAFRRVRDEEEPPPREGQQQEQPRGMPDTFDELFSHVASMSDSGEKSWKALTKAMAQSEGEAPPGNDPKRHVNVSNYVDEHGNLHHRSTVRVFDDDGNEISKYTTHQVYSKSELSSLDVDSPGDVGGRWPEPDDKSDKKGDKKGWFWK